jgi:hypothetical protein
MKTTFDRDQLLKDLRDHICEIFYQDHVSGQQKSVRCSLRPDALPQSYMLTEASKEMQFHAENPKLLSAWDIVMGGWKQFHIDTINYIQIIDTY